MEKANTNNTNKINLQTPISDDTIKSLKAGDMVYLTGYIYTARDAAHKKLVELISNNSPMPFDFTGQAVYYAGPTPAKPGKPIGSCGPTTSGRMDAYSPVLIEKGLKIMIGKGFRKQEVIDAIVKHSGLYLAAVGGAAALIAKCVKSAEVIAFDELGTEAIRRLYVEDFPLIVVVDSLGSDFYKYK